MSQKRSNTLLITSLFVTTTMVGMGLYGLSFFAERPDEVAMNNIVHRWSANTGHYYSASLYPEVGTGEGAVELQ